MTKYLTGNGFCCAGIEVGCVEMGSVCVGIEVGGVEMDSVCVGIAVGGVEMDSSCDGIAVGGVEIDFECVEIDFDYVEIDFEFDEMKYNIVEMVSPEINNFKMMLSVKLFYAAYCISSHLITKGEIKEKTPQRFLNLQSVEKILTTQITPLREIVGL